MRLPRSHRVAEKGSGRQSRNPTYRQFLANHLTGLLSAARGLGDSKGVAEAERELAELRNSDPAMVAIDARLSAIIQRNQQPKDNRERLQLAQTSLRKALHATAAKLWAEALDADPKLSEDRQAQHRYNAACAAALAGGGQGKDDKPLDDALEGETPRPGPRMAPGRAGRLDEARRIRTAGSPASHRPDPQALAGRRRPRRRPRGKGSGDFARGRAQGLATLFGLRSTPCSKDAEPLAPIGSK